MPNGPDPYADGVATQVAILRERVVQQHDEMVELRRELADLRRLQGRIYSVLFGVLTGIVGGFALFALQVGAT